MNLNEIRARIAEMKREAPPLGRESIPFYKELTKLKEDEQRLNQLEAGKTAEIQRFRQRAAELDELIEKHPAMAQMLKNNRAFVMGQIEQRSAPANSDIEDIRRRTEERMIALVEAAKKPHPNLFPKDEIPDDPRGRYPGKSQKKKDAPEETPPEEIPDEQETEQEDKPQTPRSRRGRTNRGYATHLQSQSTPGRSVTGSPPNNITNVVVNTAKESASLTLWLLLIVVLYAADWALGFAGINYQVLLEAFSAGGLELLLRLILPIHIVIIFTILLALKYAKTRGIIVFLVIVFVPLIIINMFTTDYKVLGISLSVASLITSLIVLMISLDPEDRRDFFSWVLLIMVVTTIISLGGLVRGFHRLVIAGILWAAFIKLPEDEKFTRANYIIVALLVIDFFIFGILQSFGPLKGNSILANRFIIPVWFLFVLFYGLKHKGKTNLLDKVLVGFIIFLYLMAFVDGYGGWTTIQGQLQTNPQDITQAKGFFAAAWKKMTQFPGKIVEEYNKGMNAATGGYYQGKVEENQDPRNNLGVHIEKLQAADKKFYENEEVVVWGDLKAKTLDEPVYLFLSCGADGVKGSITPPELANAEYFNDPKKGYYVERFEQVPFECRINANELGAGAKEIKVKAEFNFKTMAYLKTYFIDVERMRALRKDGIEPLKNYGITKLPEAIYTNGPIKIGMATIDPPLGLGRLTDSASYIGVTVQPEWYGKIKNITELEIQVPSLLGLDKEEFYCSNDFESAGEDKEGYSVYKMRAESLSRIKTPIDGYYSRRCSIRISKANVPQVLGNTPLAGYYYRASASYIYEIEQSTSVIINDVPGEKKILKACEVKCDDSDGCKCLADGCNVPNGESIAEGYACNTAPVGSNKGRDLNRTITDIGYAISLIQGFNYLNEKCGFGPIDETEFQKKYPHDELKSYKELISKCDTDEKVDYIHNGERRIAEQAADTVKIFANARSLNLSSEQKERLKVIKAEFISVIDASLASFSNVKSQVETAYPTLHITDSDYRTKLEQAKVQLEGINY